MQDARAWAARGWLTYPAPHISPPVQWAVGEDQRPGVLTLGEIITRSHEVQQSPGLDKVKGKNSLGFHGSQTGMKNKRRCVLCPALPCRIPRGWGKLAAPTTLCTLQESPPAGRTPQRRIAPLHGPQRKVFSGKPYESAHRRRSPCLQLSAVHPSQALVPVISPMSRHMHHPPELPLLAFSGHAGQREWAPEAGLVRAGWEAVGAAHKAERAGVKMWVLDSALQGVPQGISLSEPTA